MDVASGGIQASLATIGMRLERATQASTAGVASDALKAVATSGQTTAEEARRSAAAAARGGLDILA